MTNTHSMQRDQLQDILGRKIVARLSGSGTELPDDISERLKAARMVALSHRKIVKVQTASAVESNGSTAKLGVDDHNASVWRQFASLLPLLALVAGLFTIAVTAEDSRVREIADVDVELLTDDLPPAAYTDPGFAQFLRMNNRRD